MGVHNEDRSVFTNLSRNHTIEDLETHQSFSERIDKSSPLSLPTLVPLTRTYVGHISRRYFVIYNFRTVHGSWHGQWSLDYVTPPVLHPCLPDLDTVSCSSPILTPHLSGPPSSCRKPRSPRMVRSLERSPYENSYYYNVRRQDTSYLLIVRSFQVLRSGSRLVVLVATVRKEIYFILSHPTYLRKIHLIVRRVYPLSGGWVREMETPTLCHQAPWCESDGS